MTTRQIRRCVEEDRLVYYAQPADATFWDGHWQSQNLDRYYTNARRGRLGLLKRILLPHLPKGGRILEAGCGLGQIVVALKARGWSVEGVDYSAGTVSRIQQQYPELPIRVGDVTALDFHDETFDGYVSLGVVEHRREGPDPFLREAFRVLRPGGTAIVSVPYFNRLRAWKASRSGFDANDGGLPFYQYAFSVDDISSHLERNGFNVVRSIPYDGFKGIKDELPWTKNGLRRAQRVPIIGWGLREWLKHCSFGHMVAMVCKKPSTHVIERTVAA